MSPRFSSSSSQAESPLHGTDGCQASFHQGRACESQWGGLGTSEPGDQDSSPHELCDLGQVPTAVSFQLAYPSVGTWDTLTSWGCGSMKLSRGPPALYFVKSKVLWVVQCIFVQTSRKKNVDVVHSTAPRLSYHNDCEIELLSEMLRCEKHGCLPINKIQGFILKLGALVNKAVQIPRHSRPSGRPALFHGASLPASGQEHRPAGRGLCCGTWQLLLHSDPQPKELDHL